MWHDSEGRLTKAVARFEEGDVEAAQAMLRGLDRRGVISPRIDLYLGHCHLENDEVRAAIRRYRRSVALMGKGSPSRAAPWVGLGLCYGRLGDVARAARAFRRAQRLDPRNLEAHGHLVHCYALQGEVRRAEKHAEACVSLDATDPRPFRHLAVAYLLAGRYSQALAAWDQVDLREPGHGEVDLGRARAWLGLERLREARRHFDRATRGPHAAEAWLGLGELERHAGRPRAAQERFERALAQDPDLEDARLRVAEGALEAGETDRALALLAPLLTRTPLAGEVVSLAVRARFQQGDRKAAWALLRRLAVEAPAAPGTWHLLGERLMALGRPRLAQRMLRRAVRHHEEGSLELQESVRLLARALAQRGQGRRAVGLLARAVHRAPDSVDLHMDLAAAQMARGRMDAAERGLLRGLSASPDSPCLWTASAEMALEAGRNRLARVRLRSALRRNRRHPAALALLLRWLIARGDWRRAVHAGRVAVRRLPETDATWRDYGLALIRDGRYQEATVPLRRYVLACPQDPDGFERLGEALDGLGDADGAGIQRRIARSVLRLSS